MELRDVLKNIEIEATAGTAESGGTEILGITVNSNQVKQGSLFIAVHGNVADGHEYLDSAVRNGAAAVLVEKMPDDPQSLAVPVAKTKDSRIAASVAAANFHGNPSLGMKVVGVTGTNGKTTVSHMLEAAWKEMGLNTGLVGTIQNRYSAKTEAASLTTPDGVELAGILREMKKAEVACVALEVSSHALDLRRVDACHFDVAIFTNLTQDHLDYHGTIENYFAAKQRFFTEILEKSEKERIFSVVNADDPFADRIPTPSRGEKITFSLERKDATVFAEDFSIDAGGVRATLATPWGQVELISKLLGKHNLRNMMAATGTLLSLGSSPGATGRAVSGVTRVPGRLERVENELGIDVFVDYAHTPDALENVLGCLRPICRRGLITVVGCGGDRDPKKRPLMAAVGQKYSDALVITSDNPRTEDPEDIIEDMLRGTDRKSSTVQAVVDRQEAIRNAVEKARPGDMLLIAGKGHEDYQIIGTEKIHSDDREIVAKYMEEKSGKRLKIQP